MNHLRDLGAGLALGAAVLMSAPAQAVVVQWADLTTQSANIVGGNIGGVGVTFTGPYLFAQTSGGGTDFWIDTGVANPAYTGPGIVNRPTGTDLIALSSGGTKTITFSQAVSDFYLAFTSWNGNTTTFSAPFSVVSQGCGFWGCGAFNVNGTSTGFFGQGEVHGVLKFAGTFTSITFTDTSEGWHGLQIGIGGIANAVPEPATWAMMLIGFAGLGYASRRRRAMAT